MLNFRCPHCQKPIEIDSANNAAQGLRRLLTVDDVIETVARFHDMTRQELLEDNHAPSRSVPRQIAVLLAREMVPDNGETMSWPALARAFRRDHTTLISGYRSILRRAERNKALAQRIEALRETLKIEM